MRTDTPYISLCINLDTRKERDEFGGENLTGVVSRDFLDEGVFNKQKMLEGFDFETVVFIDKHEDIPQQSLDYLYQICDTVCIRKHTHEQKFNDANYMAAFQLCRGKIIIHCDAELATFVSSKSVVEEMIGYLEDYNFVSYPSKFSPNPDTNESYQDFWWASTRFVMFKRENMDITEWEKCLRDYDYTYEKYPAPVKNAWTEHLISLVARYRNGKGVLYPVLDYEKSLIFCFDNYEKWTLRRLNQQSYGEVKNWVLSKGGIHYPNQLHI